MSQLKKASKLELLKRVNESIVRAARAKNEKVFDNALLQTVCHRMSRGVELGGIEATTMAVVRDELKGRAHLYPLLGMVPLLRALQRLKDPAGIANLDSVLMLITHSFPLLTKILPRRLSPHQRVASAETATQVAQG
ncbi:hypothetical protein DIPPA_18118 [Diplonema papillatum]|nr:hypothetical protein DIPPA_18118 [Diplonema papillatum]